MEDVLIGITDRTIVVFIPDAASTDGSGKTGLVAANITVSNTRIETDNDVVVTDYTSSLTDLSALTDAHADWGWKEISSTLAPGLYRLDVADALFASGAWYSILYVMVTSSAASATPKAFRLIARNDLTDIAQTVDHAANVAAILDDTGTTGVPIATGGIQSTSFASAAIDAAAIAPNAIGASEIADGAIDAATFANNAITSSVVADGFITAAKIATGAIDADSLAADFVDEILDEQIGDGTITMRQALRAILAVTAGKLSGAATTTVTIRNTADSADVVVATVDADGNRTAVTLTP